MTPSLTRFVVVLVSSCSTLCFSLLVPTTQLVTTAAFLVPLAPRPRSGPLSSSSSSSSSAAIETKTVSKWDNFSYLRHWYPVHWVADLVVDQPTKISVFDVEYALALRKNGSVLALLDQCPHRAAALSEGRITSNGYLQCAYHGWSFGDAGECVQVPQAAATNKSLYSARSCAKAVPATVHQGMVWIWPGPKLDAMPKPPTIPEVDDPNFRVTRAVRDFPMIDWSLLLSNIMDPDHGMFAHQTVGFDLYSASPDKPMTIQETYENEGWNMISRVPAQEKLRARDRQRRNQIDKNMPQNITATTTYFAPCVVAIGRRDDQGNTKFLTCFWVCPTGTGKSRFMGASVAKLPFGIPRWLNHIILNNFLDQDSVLVASQQPATLTAEVELHSPRQQLYLYQSPTDRSVRLVDQFWDATLRKVPNRTFRLLELKAQGALRSIPNRRVVLDREKQHLEICPNSQDVVRNCRWVETVSLTTSMTWLVLRILKRTFASSLVWPALSLLIGLVARKIRREFYFGYPEERRNKDLSKIPVVSWLDPA